MLLSIIIPVYNAANTLDRCLESILAQLAQDFEILLIDDGSNDDSSEICDRWAGKDARIRVFHQTNAGVSSARNVGLDHAEGQWVCFIDADDTIDGAFFPEKTDLDVDLYIQNGNICHLPTGRIYSKNLKDFLSRYGHSVSLRGVFAKFVKKQILDETGLRFDTSQRVGEDTLFFMEYIRYVHCIEILNTGIYVVNSLPNEDWVMKYHYNREEAYRFFSAFLIQYELLPAPLPKLAQTVYDIFEQLANKDGTPPLSWKLHPSVLAVKHLQIPIRNRRYALRCQLARLMSFFYS